MNSTSAEPTCELAASSSLSTSTELTCELAASSSQNSLPGCRSLICLREDVPGASLNGREPSQLHVVVLKRRLKCIAATTVEKNLVIVF